MRFLVVEDEEALQHIYKIELQYAFANSVIDLASNGLEAIEFCMKHKYDLVLTDGRMPEMGGVEMAKALKASDILCPIVLVTGFTEHMHDDFTQDLFSLIKEKPLEFEEFIVEIQTLLANP